MDLTSKPVSQKAVIRQLKIDNLRQQAQLHMLTNIVAACLTGPQTWGRGVMESVMDGEGLEGFKSRKKYMLEISAKKILQESPLAADLTDQDRTEVTNFENREL